MNQIINWQTGTPDPDLSDVLRYMGVRQTAVSDVLSLAESGIAGIQKAAVCRGCYMRLPLKVTDCGIIISDETVLSRSLARHLAGCNEAFLFAATIGIGVDRHIRASASISSAAALAADAAGSASVEWVCDNLNEYLSDIIVSEGKHTCSRFSPGYGDFPLEFQRSLTAMLDTPKNIGVILTNGLMMCPTKSVTAIIGIKD